MPPYLLSAMAPAKYTINELHKIFARFFWCNKEEGKSKHWSAWLKVSLLKTEGGLGFRSLFDISNALFAKLWWRFRNSCSLWSTYMWNKYCKRQIPTLVQWKGGSQRWKKMLEARNNMEKHIWWEPRNGSANFWYDNWTKLGPLVDVMPSNFPMDESIQDVDEIMMDGRWNIPKLQQTVPKDLVEYILKIFSRDAVNHSMEKAWWLLNGNGNFTVSSAWDKLRQRKDHNWFFQQIWTKMLFSATTRNIVTYILDRRVCSRNMENILRCSRNSWPFCSSEASSQEVVGCKVFSQVEAIISGSTCYYSLATMEKKKYSSAWRDNWTSPPQGWFKCNSDGASKGNPGPSSSAYCVRDSVREFIHASVRRIADTHCLVAEAKAMYNGIVYYVNIHLMPLYVETDSLTPVKIVEGEWEVPWYTGL
ncbi:uncharacterized protein LOC132637701 [Lycium barbarum]|uniref:uncharacterized protein LOC132637701 n=1 Tax=Lycium barbarum TaxID=112863 RepID=UPI00293F5869|nr:uncharacterized protein LOC132637701 [Lycium barbarum]